MSKFKVGDTIRCVTKDTDTTVGKTYMICRIDSDGDAFIIDDIGDQLWITESYFELTDQRYLILSGNGWSANSKDAAIAKAKELAEQSEGTAFTVIAASAAETYAVSTAVQRVEL